MSARPERRPREPRPADADERLRQFLQWREETGRARPPLPRSSFPFFGTGVILALIAIGVAWWTATSGFRRPPVTVKAPAPVSAPAAPEPPPPAAEVAPADGPEPAASPVASEPPAQPAVAEPAAPEQAAPQLAAPAAEIAPPAPAEAASEDTAPPEPAPDLPARRGKRFAVDRVPAGGHRPAPLTRLGPPPATREETTAPAGEAIQSEAPTTGLPPRGAPGKPPAR
jgi:hypothetical protein